MINMMLYFLVSMICGTIIILGIYVYPIYLMNKQDILRLKIRLKELEGVEK